MGIETRSGFKPNHREFGMHIRSEEARRPANIVARKIAIVANATAPVQGDTGKESRRRKREKPVRGAFRAVTGRKAGNLRVGRNSRAIAQVVGKAPGIVYSEGGTKNQKPNRTLLRAAITVSMREFGKWDGRPRGKG